MDGLYPCTIGKNDLLYSIETWVYFLERKMSEAKGKNYSAMLFVPCIIHQGVENSVINFFVERHPECDVERVGHEYTIRWY